MPAPGLRTTITMTVALAALVLLPGVALAHASFDVRQLPAGATQDLVLRVPLERDAGNELVEVLVPGAFTVGACAGAEGWACRQDATADGDTVVAFARAADGAGDTERFALTVTPPAQEGVYAFPTIQTYDDGEEVAWIGEDDSERPAPRIQVGDETAPVEFGGEASPHTDPAEDGATPAPSPTPTDAATAAPTTDATAAPGPGERSETPGPAATRDPDGAAEEGGLGTAVLVGVAVAAAAAVAGAVAVRRRGRGRG